MQSITCVIWERSGSVAECLTRDRGAAGSSLTGVTALCPWARHMYPSLVLVQPRKTRPFITERLLMGRKESNQTNKHVSSYAKEKCVRMQNITCVILCKGLYWSLCKTLHESSYAKHYMCHFMQNTTCAIFCKTLHVLSYAKHYMCPLIQSITNVSSYANLYMCPGKSVVR